MSRKTKGNHKAYGKLGFLSRFIISYQLLIVSLLFAEICFFVCCLGECNIKLRPASPFMPVYNALSREVHRQKHMRANDVKINIPDNSFSSIGKLTLKSLFRLVLRVCSLYLFFLVQQGNTSSGYVP